MIGVVARADQSDVVEEFFELFKTPWEYYRAGRHYDVVIAAAGGVLPRDARLLIVFGSTATDIEAQLGVEGGNCQDGGTLDLGAGTVPLYGRVLTFSGSGKGRAFARSNSRIAAIQAEVEGCTVLRCGYDLFDEVRHLLSQGQPAEQAPTPTLDLHIRMLRDCILNAGMALLEIPPVPANCRFAVCLTHDIDFAGIRRHVFDHSAIGFLYRATIGSVRRLAQRRLSVKQTLQNWLAAASLPFVYAGWARDFWEPFGWYAEVERGLAATYFVIPFKGRAGDRVSRPNAARRASAYDVNDIRDEIAVLRRAGCEVGVHGIDAWHDAEKGREELERVAAAVGASEMGIRMHWLMWDQDTPATLERAGYRYDATCGYNEAIGYRAGTSQVFRPLGAEKLLELPTQVQDGAMFYPQQMNLSEAAAEQRCRSLIRNAEEHGGVLTLIWHDRSHAPERFWGGFYARLLEDLKARGVWFGTAAQVVDWFRARREVRFEQDERGVIRLRSQKQVVEPGLILRFHRPAKAGNEAATPPALGPEPVDVAWNGTRSSAVEELLQGVSTWWKPAGVEVSPAAH